MIHMLKTCLYPVFSPGLFFDFRNMIAAALHATEHTGACSVLECLCENFSPKAFRD